MIHPTIFASTIGEAQRRLDVAAQHNVQSVQTDVGDGQFIEALLLTPADFATCNFHELRAEFHLMTEEPLDYVYELIEHKDALPTAAVIAQVERMSFQRDYVETVVKHDWKVGLSLDLYTPVDAIDADVLPDLDIVQVMGAKAGREGQKLQQYAVDKIAELAQLQKQHEFSFTLMVDIGVKLDTIEQLRAAGAQEFAVGSALWNADDFAQTYKALQGKTS